MRIDCCFARTKSVKANLSLVWIMILCLCWDSVIMIFIGLSICFELCGMNCDFSILGVFSVMLRTYFFGCASSFAHAWVSTDQQLDFFSRWDLTNYDSQIIFLIMFLIYKVSLIRFDDSKRNQKTSKVHQITLSTLLERKECHLWGTCPQNH